MIKSRGMIKGRGMIKSRGMIKGRGMIKSRGMINGRHLALYQIFKTSVFTTKYMIKIYIRKNLSSYKSKMLRILVYSHKKMSNVTGATSGEGTDYRSGTHYIIGSTPSLVAFLLFNLFSVLCFVERCLLFLLI